MEKTNSRTADKFVVRLPEGVRDLVEASSWQLNMSMNTWVLQAITEKLDRDKRQELLLDALVEAVKKKQEG